MDYRKFYFQCLGIDPVRGFDVHHIDLNRENNSIVNLVALPKKLHKAYHRSFILDSPNGKIIIDPVPPTSIMDTGNGYMRMLFKELSLFMPIYEELQAWIAYRDHLLNGYPNFNNLSYDKY